MADALREALTPEARKEVIRSAIAKAIEGDVQAMKLIFERMDGHVPQALEHSGPDKGPVVLRYTPDLDAD